MNADVILIMGSNMAENHPVGFQWVMEGKERGTKVIHVDPRFSRTSAVSDIWAPLRAGSDFLFLGGLVNYVLQNDRDFRDYVVNYTNASVIIGDDFKDTEDLDGLFSGWDPERSVYDTRTWAYDNCAKEEAPPQNLAHGGHAKDSGRTTAPDVSSVERDETLQHPRCVYQILKRHFARYTPEMVERTCGVPRDLFLKIAETFCSASARRKLAASATPWAGRSTRTECRSYARQRYCNSCSAISGVREVESWRYVATLPFRAQPISRLSSTFCRVTCPCRSTASTRVTSRPTLTSIATRPAGGGIPISTS